MQYSCNPFIYKVVKDLVLRHLHSMYAAEYVILFLILISQQERMCKLSGIKDEIYFVSSSPSFEIPAVLACSPAGKKLQEFQNWWMMKLFHPFSQKIENDGDGDRDGNKYRI